METNDAQIHAPSRSSPSLSAKDFLAAVLKDSYAVHSYLIKLETDNSNLKGELIAIRENIHCVAQLALSNMLIEIGKTILPGHHQS